MGSVLATTSFFDLSKGSGKRHSSEVEFEPQVQISTLPTSDMGLWVQCYEEGAA